MGVKVCCFRQGRMTKSFTKTTEDHDQNGVLKHQASVGESHNARIVHGDFYRNGNSTRRHQ
jgi:hypothetical protein